MWVLSIRVFYNLFGDQIVFCEREIVHMVVHALKKGDFFPRKSLFDLSVIYIPCIEILATFKFSQNSWLSMKLSSKNGICPSCQKISIWENQSEKDDPRRISYCLNMLQNATFASNYGVNILMKSHFYIFQRHILPNKVHIF